MKSLRLCPRCAGRPVVKTYSLGVDYPKLTPSVACKNILLVCPRCFPRACHSELIARGETIGEAVRAWNELVVNALRPVQA